MGDVDKIGFIKRVWSGDIGLAKAFWIFGMLGVLGLGFSLLMMRTVTPTNTHNAQLAFFVSTSLYNIVVPIIIWKAANKYQGLALWRFLAKVFSIFASLIFAFAGYIIVVIGMDSLYKFVVIGMDSLYKFHQGLYLLFWIFGLAITIWLTIKVAIKLKLWFLKYIWCTTFKKKLLQNEFAPDRLDDVFAIDPTYSDYRLAKWIQGWPKVFLKGTILAILLAVLITYPAFDGQPVEVRFPPLLIMITVLYIFYEWASYIRFFPRWAEVHDQCSQHYDEQYCKNISLCEVVETKGSLGLSRFCFYVENNEDFPSKRNHIRSTYHEAVDASTSWGVIGEKTYGSGRKEDIMGTVHHPARSAYTERNRVTDLPRLPASTNILFAAFLQLFIILMAFNIIHGLTTLDELWMNVNNPYFFLGLLIIGAIFSANPMYGRTTTSVKIYNDYAWVFGFEINSKLKLFSIIPWIYFSFILAHRLFETLSDVGLRTATENVIIPLFFLTFVSMLVISRSVVFISRFLDQYGKNNPR